MSNNAQQYQLKYIGGISVLFNSEGIQNNLLEQNSILRVTFLIFQFSHLKKIWIQNNI